MQPELLRYVWLTFKAAYAYTSYGLVLGGIENEMSKARICG